jgi:hypothetical protein
VKRFSFRTIHHILFIFDCLSFSSTWSSH